MKIERTGTGYLLDPNAYLDWLDNSWASLPPGAATFAREPGHYDVHSARCVKDLKPGHLELTDRNDELTLRLVFSPNQFKHDQGLEIRYRDVVALSVDSTAGPRAGPVWPDTRRLGDLQLDEILPHEKGCSHEIQLTGGVIRVVAADLTAEWRDAPADP